MRWRGSCVEIGISWATRELCHSQFTLPGFQFHECRRSAESAHALPNAKLCHAADFIGNDVQMGQFEPVLERALSFLAFPASPWHGCPHSCKAPNNQESKDLRPSQPSFSGSELDPNRPFWYHHLRVV